MQGSVSVAENAVTKKALSLTEFGFRMANPSRCTKEGVLNAKPVSPNFRYACLCHHGALRHAGTGKPAQGPWDAATGGGRRLRSGPWRIQEPEIAAVAGSECGLGKSRGGKHKTRRRRGSRFQRHGGGAAGGVRPVGFDQAELHRRGRGVLRRPFHGDEDSAGLRCDWWKLQGVGNCDGAEDAERDSLERGEERTLSVGPRRAVVRECARRQRSADFAGSGLARLCANISEGEEGPHRSECRF